MSAEQPWQVLASCPHCHVEAALVQLMDPHHPASHLGRPISQRCRLCGWQARAVDEPFAPRHAHRTGRCPACHKALSEAARTGRGVCAACGYGPRLRETHPPMALSTEEVAIRALARWAMEEGESDVTQFCEAYMGGSDVQVARALVSGEVVHTSFDVIAYLFPGAGSAGGGGSVVRAPKPAPDTSAPTSTPTMHPRTPARVLISVMVADGELRPGELRFIRDFLAAEGLDDLEESDLRIWRPQELGTAPDSDLRERLVEAAVHLMHLDRQRDGSEWKVVRSFAGAWGVTDAQLQAWDKAYDARYATTMTRLWTSLSNLVRLS